MLAALPPETLKLGHEIVSLDDQGGKIRLSFAEHDDAEADVVVGADGLNSFVRRTLWGEEPIRHQKLHLVGGYLFLDQPPPGEGVISHNRTTQVSYTPIRHEGKWGYEWWVLEAYDPSSAPPTDLMGFCKERAKDFSRIVRDLIDQTPIEHLQRWEIRDRPPLKQWSKGRVTLVGDAAHPTSPYAAYGAGMSIEDGYFLARELARVDVNDRPSVIGALQAFEDRRKPHTATVSQTAYYTGRMFHHMPKPMRFVRDLVYDHTPLLQKMIGDKMPDHILAQLAEIEDA